MSSKKDKKDAKKDAKKDEPKDKKKKQSAGMKINKSVGSSVGTSKVGKALIKDVLGKDVRQSASLFTHFVQGHQDVEDY